jgi:serine/threonine-protein kinase
VPPSGNGSRRSDRPKLPSLELASGTVVAGKYTLERVLNRGGMGSVWVAAHGTLDVQVAIKFMKPVEQPESDLDTGDAEHATQAVTLRRFEREAKAAAKIRSSNVVQILDHGVDRGTPYIVMELLDGEDLATRLKRGRYLPIDEVARILTPVARALTRAHKEGLVHRDLKPENIFLAAEGDQEVPKILDFGVAKAMPETGTQEVDGSTVDGVVVGSPHYMSPEQAMGRPDIDARSDIWSLGVIAFRMITGRVPFSPASVLEAVVQICSSPIPRASSIRPELPPEVDAFFEKALSRDPVRRFQSPMDLANALTALAPGGADAARVESGDAHLAQTGAGGTTSPGTHEVASEPDSPVPMTSRPRRAIVATAALAVLLIGVAALGRRLSSEASSEAPKPAANREANDSSTAAVPAAPSAVASVTAEAQQADPSTATSATGAPSLPKTPHPPASVSPKATTSKSTRKVRDVGY